MFEKILLHISYGIINDRYEHISMNKLSSTISKDAMVF